MNAFALPLIAPVRGNKLLASSIYSTSVFPHFPVSPKLKRSSILRVRMESSEKETSKPSSGKTSNEVQEDDDDERLQKDPVYVYKEFGKVSAVALLIGLVLFFYDILISLWVTTLGLLYALAVLFEVKGADTLLTNVLNASVRLFRSVAEGVRKGWKALTTEVRKALKE